MKSMRNNLVFFNILDEEGEQCCQVIQTFSSEKINIENAETKISISEAHRLGMKEGHIRPELVIFLNYENRDFTDDNGYLPTVMNTNPFLYLL